MTDTRLGRSPRSEAELVREFDRRLKALERSQTARIGPWVLSAPDGRLLATRPGEAALEVGQPPTPEVVDLSSRGSVVSDMNTADLANAVGMPDVDPEAPPTIDQIRQWMVTNLFGPVAPGRIQQLPWAHLGGGTAELLDDPGFDSSATFNAGDPNITRNAEFGRSKPGSAQIVANGAAHLVVSNLIAVEQGEKLPVGVWVFYEELVASAAPVRVSVRAYHSNADDSLTLLSTTQVAALTATSGESADHPDQDDDWVWLGGTYAVPGPVGGLTVTDVVLEAKVTEDATGGTINVDDATVTKTRDGLPQDWILNLVPDLASVWNGVAGTVETIMTSLGLTPSGTFWDDLFDLSDEIAWIQDKANDAGADAAAALADLASKLGISDWDNWLSSTWDGFKATLLTNPGSLLGMLGMNKITDLPALNTDFVALQNILSGAATTPPTTLLQQVKDWWTATQQKTQHLTSGGNLPPANVGSPTGGTNIGQDILDTLNGIWAGLRGAGSTTGKTATDVAVATAATADLVTQVSSTAARLDASVSQVIKGGGGGTNDQFEREDTDLGDDWDWTNVGAGAIATNGNSAYWSPSGGSAASQVARNKTFETATNWQNASFVLTEPLNATSGWMLCGRMNAARDTYVYMFVKKDYREIGYVASGTPHVLASSTDPYEPPPGTKVEAFFGHELFNEDTFWLAAPSMASGMTVPSTAPAKGPGYRNMGFGAKVVAVSGAQVSPGSLELWTGGDSQSPPTVGVYLEAERSVLSSPYATLSNGNLPSGFLTVTRQSDWISFDASTTTFTVELPGAYHVWATLSINANLTTGNSVDLKTFGSGVEFQLYAPRLVPGGGIEQQLSGVLYLDSGDQIQLLCQLAGSATKKAVGSLRVAKLSPPYFA